MNPRIPLNFLFNVLFWYLLSLMGKICLHPSHYKSKMVRHNVITVYHLLALFMGGGVVEWLVEWQCQQKHIFIKKLVVSRMQLASYREKSLFESIIRIRRKFAYRKKFWRIHRIDRKRMSLIWKDFCRDLNWRPLLCSLCLYPTEISKG